VAKKEKLAVMVTTEAKGVFFGYIDAKDESNSDKLVVEECQMAVYFSSSIGGVLGLTYTGPDKNCRISNPAPQFLLHKITGVARVTKEAEKNWRKFAGCGF